MGIPYEVTYRNTWPSEQLKARVRQRAREVRAQPIEACRAWFERRPDDGQLVVRIELVEPGATHAARRVFPAGARPDEVLQAIDALFAELRRHLRLDASRAHAA